MEWFRKLRMVYKIVLPVSITLVLVLGILTWQIQTKGSEIVQAVAERELVALGGKYGGEVQNFISGPLNTAQEMANIIAYMEEDNLPLSRKQIIDILSHTIKSDLIISVSVALLPSSDDVNYENEPGSDANGQFYPYVNVDGLQLLDRASFKEGYFTEPQKTLKPYISDPYNWTEPSGRVVLMSSIGAPIIVNGVFKGVIILDFSLDAMAEKINDIKLYTTGVVSVLTQEGILIAHPNPKLILANMFELDKWSDNHSLRTALRNGEFSSSIAFDGEKESIYYFTPLLSPQTGQIMYVALIVPLEELLADVAQITNATLMASVIALIVLLLVIFIGVSSSVKPLAIISAAAQKISMGDYSAKVDSSKFGGEILELENSISAMVGSLIENINKAKAMSKDAQEQTAKAQIAMREAEAARLAAEGAKREGMLAAAEQLEGVVSIISTASQQLSVQIEQSEHGFNVQAARVAETATAMEEMNSTVLEVASNASAASEMSIQTRSRAEAGARIVEEAVAGVQRVQRVSLALKDDMAILAKQAESITTIMNVISDIADQTNLLALNAAIEAARAGDAGRGFAVVADEVRKLAEKTAISTSDVGSAIKSIQASVSTNIHQVDQAVELITSVTEQAGQSGIALAEIVSLVDGATGQVQAIATASEEQSATSEEINRAITEINSIAINSAQTMRESASAVNDLAVQTQALSNLIDEMKRG